MGWLMAALLIDWRTNTNLAVFGVVPYEKSHVLIVKLFIFFVLFHVVNDASSSIICCFFLLFSDDSFVSLVSQDQFVPI